MFHVLSNVGYDENGNLIVIIDYFKRIQDVHHYATLSCSRLYTMQVNTDAG